MKLDRINLNILACLQENARITNQDLAEKVNLSPSACLTRTRRLEAEGYITRYRADVALDRVGPVLSAFMEVTLESHFPNDFKKFDAYIAQKKEIVSGFMLGASFDYLLRVVVRDMAQLRRLSDEMLGADIGVIKLHTLPVLEDCKVFSGYPLEALLAD
ncbi:Lrp/AsnC family transcriptional regulator [Kordiimonas marina]|uniref:Lrp/AsnC family transcriptional regulator n=1 Tax=Kordiimonas marina TaxID=2872312 RepID=UPI001FF3ADAA|nr:Lrp/AsnC family transcriptional regulator [Kordiimonas marina]MCJ9430661.1 Lrp/AsnC family transcriptional regulator [Kordiimonas marina]